MAKGYFPEGVNGERLFSGGGLLPKAIFRRGSVAEGYFPEGAVAEGYFPEGVSGHGQGQMMSKIKTGLLGQLRNKAMVYSVTFQYGIAALH